MRVRSRSADATRAGRDEGGRVRPAPPGAPLPHLAPLDPRTHTEHLEPVEEVKDDD